MTRRIAIFPLCVLGLVAVTSKKTPAQDFRPQSIAVTANDYTFLGLPEIKSGNTAFSFTNQGKVTHEMFIARLKVGATPDEYLRAANDPQQRRGLLEDMIGILFAGPGKSPSGKLLVDLVPGATYIVSCNMKDKPDAPGHLTYGMLTSFTVK